MGEADTSYPPVSSSASLGRRPTPRFPGQARRWLGWPDNQATSSHPRHRRVGARRLRQSWGRTGMLRAGRTQSW